MKTRHALLAVLATIQMTACHSSDCDPLSEDFSISEFVTAEQLDKIMADYPLPGQEEVVCEEACSVAYLASRGWEVGGIENCNLTLPAYPNHDALVSCTGMGVEYICEGH